jgi:hypothetical protein
MGGPILKKLLAALVAAAAFGGIVNVAVAEPGPNGSNNHGLCTAYFNGSANGRAHKQEAGPFVALMMAAANSDGVDNDDDGDTDEGDETTGAEGVFDYCTEFGIGGNPDDPSTEGDDGNGQNGTGKG